MAEKNKVAKEVTSFKPFGSYSKRARRVLLAQKMRELLRQGFRLIMGTFGKLSCPLEDGMAPSLQGYFHREEFTKARNACGGCAMSLVGAAKECLAPNGKLTWVPIGNALTLPFEVQALERQLNPEVSSKEFAAVVVWFDSFEPKDAKWLMSSLIKWWIDTGGQSMYPLLRAYIHWFNSQASSIPCSKRRAQWRRLWKQHFAQVSKL